MQLLILALPGETCAALAAPIFHAGQIGTCELSSIARALDIYADELRPIDQAGNTCAAHIANPCVGLENTVYIKSYTLYLQ